MTSIFKAGLVGIVGLVLSGAAAGGNAVTKTPDQLTWVRSSDAPETSIAAVWGDPAKGAHGAFHRFAAGFVAPLHTHSSDLRLVVISGTFAWAGEDGKETTLPPGSYFYEPRGFRHVTKCLDGSDCVAFVVANGKFDVKLVDRNPPASK